MPRVTLRWSALPSRERRKSPIPSPPCSRGAGARRRGGGTCSIGERRSGSGCAGSGPGHAAGQDLVRALRVGPLAVLRPQRRGSRRRVHVGRRVHARRRPEQPRVHDRRRDALLRQQRHRRLADTHRREQRLDVVQIGRRVGRHGRAQLLRVARRERPQRVLDPQAELREHLLGQVGRLLGHEEHADALGADQPHGALERVQERVGRLVEQQVRLVEEHDELRRRQVARLRERLEQLGDQPHQGGRPQRRLVLHGRELDARDDAAAVGRDRHQVGDVELRLAEELGPAAGLEPHERAQQHADGGRGEPADALELGLARVGVQEGEQRAQVAEVQQWQALPVGVVVHEREARLLRLVRTEHLGQQLRAEVGHGRPDRHARSDPAEREELHRERLRRERQPEVCHPLLAGAAGLGRYRQSGHIALDVGDEHGHAGARELLGDHLQRLGLAGSCRAGHEPVPVHGGERDLHRRLPHELAVVDPAPEVDRGALGCVRGS